MLKAIHIYNSLKPNQHQKNCKRECLPMLKLELNTKHLENKLNKKILPTTTYIINFLFINHLRKFS
jgi:hypothetical protein